MCSFFFLHCCLAVGKLVHGPSLGRVRYGTPSCYCPSSDTTVLTYCREPLRCECGEVSGFLSGTLMGAAGVLTVCMLRGRVEVIVGKGEGTVFLIMGIITGPVMKMHGAQCLIHIPLS